MKEIWRSIKQSIEHAQQIQKGYADNHQQEVNFQVGDNVWLSLKNYKSDCPNKKLDSQMAGSFLIVKQIGHSYHLDLSQSMQIHNIFSSDKLQLTANDPLPGQIVEPLEPVVIGDNQEWEVEKILNFCLYRKKLWYQVKWVGFDDDTTWYPASDFKGSPHQLRDFHSKYPDQPGPS